jgi:hypothetical protein
MEKLLLYFPDRTRIVICKDASTLLELVLMWLAMLASNVDDMTSHETSKFKIFNLKTMANKLKYDYSLYTPRVNIRIHGRRSLASNWSSVDEDLRAQVKARRVSRRAQAWRARARKRVMWTRHIGYVLIEELFVSVFPRGSCGYHKQWRTRNDKRFPDLPLEKKSGIWDCFSYNAYIFSFYLFTKCESVQGSYACFCAIILMFCFWKKIIHLTKLQSTEIALYTNILYTNDGASLAI